jgi:hypothetical protein
MYGGEWVTCGAATHFRQAGVLQTPARGHHQLHFTSEYTRVICARNYITLTDNKDSTSANEFSSHMTVGLCGIDSLPSADRKRQDPDTSQTLNVPEIEINKPVGYNTSISHLQQFSFTESNDKNI